VTGIRCHCGASACEPFVRVDPAIREGDPTLRGIPTDAIADHHWLNDDVEDDFGLTRHELLVVLWFEGSRGQPEHRQRWGVWAEQVHGPLYRVTSLDEATLMAIELPPTRGDGS
jgi:hypothetical protein